MSDSSALYEFVFRGQLAEHALDEAGRSKHHLGQLDSEIAWSLSLDVLDPELVDAARRMSTVYTAIAAFENAVRRFVVKVLLEQVGADWWATSVTDRIRKQAETRRNDEETTKWHAQRGDNLVEYTELGALANIIDHNWEHFEPHVRSIQWAKSIFGSIERSRNVIMHSGTLDLEDIARVGLHIRDWVKQVGT
jgi:HEPN superfamily Swt1-like protein